MGEERALECRSFIESRDKASNGSQNEQHPLLGFFVSAWIP